MKGCGGVYPLAATLSAESSSSKEDRGKLVALTFSMQGVGYFVVPFFTWILTFIFGDKSDYLWRCLLGFGALPGILLTVMRSGKRIHQQTYFQTEPAFVGEHVHRIDNELNGLQGFEEESIQDKDRKPSLLEAIKSEKELFRKLIGTAGCWFLFDVLFYGNTLFQPVVLEAVFGGTESFRGLARDQTIVALLALPGYLIAVAVMERQSARYIQMQGFFAMAVLYLIIGVSFYSLSSQRGLLLVLYGSTFFFSDYGPNTTVSSFLSFVAIYQEILTLEFKSIQQTFMLPSMTFSPACRSTLNGISAASGKTGALIGTLLFQPTAAKFGDDKVMLICSFLSLIGMLLTLIGVKPDVGRESSFTKSTVFKMSERNRQDSAPSLLDYRN